MTERYKKDLMILLFGSNGQIGSHLSALLGKGGKALTRKDVDLSRPDALRAMLHQHAPKAIINAAAYTQVDKAESEQELAHSINATAPRIMAEYCAQKHIPLLHYSTDYVFDGAENTTWTEEDEPHPLNIYGATKYAGEEAVIESGCPHLILRTSWVYNENGHNFLNTILRLAREKDELCIVSDQHGAPTYAGHIAAATLKALKFVMSQPHFPNGLYHVTNGGETTWYEFARAIVTAAGAHEALKVKTITPITTAEYPTPAARPHFSVLDCSKAKRELGIQLPTWQEGLAACMKKKYAR